MSPFGPSLQFKPRGPMVALGCEADSQVRVALIDPVAIDRQQTALPQYR